MEQRSLIEEGFFADVRLDSAAQNKLNVHAQEFSMNQNARAMGFFPQSNGPLLHSKSGANMQQQIQELAARRHAVHMANLAANTSPRAIIVSHPMQMRQLSMGMTVPNAQMTSNGNAVNVSRLKWVPLRIRTVDKMFFFHFTFSLRHASNSPWIRIIRKTMKMVKRHT